MSQGIAPQAQMTVSNDIVVDPSLEEDADEEDEHSVKRQRLDDGQDSALEDEAVLNALTSHNNPTPPSDYATE